MKTKTKKALQKIALDTWKKEALELEGHKCAFCKKTEHLNVHHLISSHILATRTDIDNAIVLCSGCHRFNKICSPHQGPLGFFFWFFYVKKDKARAERLLSKIIKDNQKGLYDYECRQG